MSTATPGTSAPAPTSPAADRIRSRITHSRTFYAGLLADSQCELAKAEIASDAFARGMYQGRIAAFRLILADLDELDELDELQEDCRHA